MFLPNDNYIVNQYNSENGLPQNSAKDLLLDKNGFLWITTEDGLVRFDGRRFRVYNMSNTSFLRTNRFSIISETPRREVLFTSGFDPSVIYKAMPDYRLMIDSHATELRHKLISYHSNGIFDLAPLFGYNTKHNVSPVDTFLLNSILNSNIYWVLNEKEAVVRHVDNWYYLNNSSREMIKLPVPPEQPVPRGQAVLPEHKEMQQAFFSNGFFGVLREEGKILFFKNGRPAGITIDGSVTAMLKKARAASASGLLIYTKGNLVIAKSGNDIYELIVEKNGLKAKLLFEDLQFLENQSFYSFQYDKGSDRLFVGTQNDGFYVVSKRRFTILAFRTTDPSANIFMASQLLSGERVLTSNGVLDRTGRGRDLVFSEEERIDRHCLFKAADGRIWLSKDKRLRIYDSTFSQKLTEDTLPLESHITAILEASDRAIWISTISTLLKYEYGKLRVVLDRHPLFLEHNIETMAEISPGVIWIGTQDGIYLYHMDGNKVEELPLLAHASTRSIFQARDKSIWIGTYGSGYFKYLGGHFIPLPLDSHKYLAIAHTFAEDNKGFFWIPTNHGLFRIKKNDLESFSADNTRNVFFEYFEKSSGFNANEFNGGCNPASLKDREGNLYFPSLNGIVRFHPDSLRHELPDKDIFINDFLVDSNRQDHKQLTGIKPDFNRIIVDIATPFYGLEDNLQLEYKMDPIGEKWYPVESGGKIIIHRLPHGKYTLRIRKLNGSGEGNFTYVSIPFQVLPHWYNSGWFDLGLAAAFIGLVLVIFRLRTRILLRQNIRLQGKVEERTLELEQSALLKEKLISVIMHDLRSPLFSMSMLINYLNENYKSLDPAEVTEILGQLEESSRGLCQFSTDFLTWYNSQKDGFTIRNEHIALEEFTREIGTFYKDMADRKGISIIYEILPGLVLFSDRNILAIILRNIMDNAVKYTKSGSISVRAEEKDTNILIRVGDTGRGMTRVKTDELLSYTENGSNKLAATFGYRFITELIRKLGGNLGIESEPGKGTVVTLTLRS